MFRMVSQDYTIADMIEHRGGRDNALKDVGTCLMVKRI